MKHAGPQARDTCHKNDFVWKFTGKITDANPGDIVLCEPAQSKRTWTFHKSHFVWKFTGKMPDAPATTSIKCGALTLTVRTVATLFGEIYARKIKLDSLSSPASWNSFTSLLLSAPPADQALCTASGTRNVLGPRQLGQGRMVQSLNCSKNQKHMGYGLLV